MTNEEIEEITQEINKLNKYDTDYLRVFTEWVQEWFNLNTFPPFLFREKGVLCDVGCGNCLRCLVKYQIFENLEKISYDISVRTKTIFPVTVLKNMVEASKRIFIRIEDDEV